jgi:hypothetical protein
MALLLDHTAIYYKLCNVENKDICDKTRHSSYGGLSDEVAVGVNVPVDVSSIDESAHSLAQSTTCRRGVLTKIYGNENLKAGKCQILSIKFLINLLVKLKVPTVPSKLL